MLTNWTDLVTGQRADSFENALTGLGNPEIDKGAASLPVNRRLPPGVAQTLYRTNGIARRLVDILPDKATSKGWRVDIPHDDEDTDPDLDPLKSEDERLDVRGKVAQAWKFARRDGGAFILIVTDTENEDLSEPLGEGASIAALQVYTAHELSPLAYEDDIRSPNYRDPKAYQLTPAVGGNSGVVDVSRILYFAGAILDPQERHRNQGLDDSIYQSSFDQIRNVTTVGQAGANLAQELNLHVIKTSVPEELDASSGMIFYAERMKLLARQKSSVGMVVLGADEDYITLTANIGGFKDLSAVTHDELSAVSGLPHTAFFGQAPGGLNTDGGSQRQIVNDLVALTQQRFLEIPLKRLYSVLRPGMPDGWRIVFHPSSDMTSTEQGTLEKTHAETDAIRIASGMMTPEHIAASRYSEAGYQNEIAAIDPEDLEGPTKAEMDLEIAKATAAPMLAPTQEPAAEEIPDDAPPTQDES